jgi:hypothetical protein
MKRVNQNDFYVLGSAVHPLTEVKADTTFNEHFLTMFTALAGLTALIESPTMPLRICIPACTALRDAIQGLVPTTGEEWTSKKIEPLAAWNLNEAAKKFETVLAAELQMVDTYFVDQKGAYSTPDLIERAQIVLPVAVLTVLSPTAVEDVKQAGRALVFDLPTAAGFHILRATESVLRDYFVAVTGKAPGKRTWGALVAGLRKRGDAKVLAAVDQIRDLHRNPLMHPEVVLTEPEALSVFGMAQSAIVAMASEISKKRVTGLPTPSAVTT